MNQRHVLVIGGAGYIGSVLVRQLLNRDYRVTILDNLIYGNGASVSGLGDQDGFTFIKGDFTDPAVLDKALDSATDVVLLAALVGDPICKKYPELAQRTNFDGPVALLGRMKSRGINRFVFTSTCSNYGLMPDDTPAAEDSALNPQSLYAVTKVAYEKEILKAAPEVDYCPVILRLSTAFGISERMRFDLTISEFTREMAMGRELVVYDENTWRPYCHTQDISEAILRVLESPEAKVRGEVFNVGGEKGNYTKKMIVEEILKQIPDGRVVSKGGGSDPRNYRVSFGKIRSALDFVPRVTVERAVRDLIRSVQNDLYADYDSRRNFYGNYEI
jgi:nucleoside-diphosphate-sugar epimerase